MLADAGHLGSLPDSASGVPSIWLYAARRSVEGRRQVERRTARRRRVLLVAVRVRADCDEVVAGRERLCARDEPR